MQKRALIYYGLLLIIPTMIIGIIGFSQIHREKDRFILEARLSASNRAQTIADSLQFTLEAIENRLMDSLNRIPDEDLITTLIEWEDTNPLARNVFVWKEKEGFLYPETERWLSSEKKKFLARYNTLFSKGVPWKEGLESKSERDDSPYPDSSSGYMEQTTKKLKSGKQSLMDLAKGKKESESSLPNSVIKGMSGWIPWFAENKLHLLGWVKKKGGLIYGVELEVMTVLSRLMTDFPSAMPTGVVYALIDGNQGILHLWGGKVFSKKDKPEVSLSLAPFLPHWDIEVYFVNKTLLSQSSRNFMIFSGLLLTILLVAMLGGGILLAWQAHQNMIDAQQKTSFVSNVSHELKTPLTSIRMYAELLFEKRIKDAAKQKKYLQVIVEESQRLTRLVNNVLDFSRLEQKEKKYSPQKIEMRSFIEKFEESHLLHIQKAGLGLNKDIPADNIFVYMDKDVMEQALLNLIDNAIKYASEGGDIILSLKAGDKFAELRVMDRGKGINVFHRERIFTKFYRIDNSLTAPQPGSGLGLSIARRLLRDLNGDIFYEQREGGGSSFVILIPYCSDHKGEKPS